MLAVCTHVPILRAEENVKTAKSPPSGAFLEYLSELVEVDGKLIHPTALHSSALVKSTEKAESPKSSSCLKSKVEQIACQKSSQTNVTKPSSANELDKDKEKK